MKIKIVSFLVISSVFSSSLFAETGPLGFGEAEFKREMQTDRPDFTEGTLTVEAGHIQVEAGYTYVTDSDEGVDLDSHALPEFLLRAGLAEHTELRLFWEGYINEDSDVDGIGSDTSGGVSDLSIGFKHTMGYQDGIIPEHGIIVELGVPLGNDEFTNDKVQPIIKFLWAYELNEELSIAGNLNFDFPVVDDERFLELSNAVSAAYSLTDELGAYLEYFGFYPDDTDVDTTTQHFVNGGFTYLLNADVQFDLRAGFGLNDAASDFFSGVGITFR